MSETRVQTVLLGVACVLLAVVAGVQASSYQLAKSVESKPFNIQVWEGDLVDETVKLAKSGGRVHLIHLSGEAKNDFGYTERYYRVIGD